jgi:hypothetical protein
MSVDLPAIHAQHQRIDIVQRAIKDAAQMVDGHAYLDIDGKRELKTQAELNHIYDEETAKLAAMGPQFT